jgi:hypothetical protein
MGQPGHEHRGCEQQQFATGVAIVECDGLFVEIEAGHFAQ